jgi:hypothetical protein
MDKVDCPEYLYHTHDLMQKLCEVLILKGDKLGLNLSLNTLIK